MTLLIQYIFTLIPLKLSFSKPANQKKFTLIRTFAEKLCSGEDVPLPLDFTIENSFLNKERYRDSDLS